MDGMSNLRVHVPEMDCPRRVREVTALLRDVAGVAVVSVDIAGSVVCLRGSMDVEGVLDVLAGASYAAEVV